MPISPYIYIVLQDKLDETVSDVFDVFHTHKDAVEAIKKFRPKVYCTMETDYDEIDSTEYCFEYETYSFTIHQRSVK